MKPRSTLSNKRAPERGRPDAAPRIQSIGRIAGILDALVAAPRGSMQLSELARACGLAKTTIFTLLDSLVKIGLVDRSGTGYRLGVRNLFYGRAVERHLDILAIARPALIRLSTLTRETVNLAVPRPFEAFIIDSFECGRSVRMSPYAGTPAPYHSTACGRALLAFQPRALIDSLYCSGPLKQITERTLIMPSAIERELDNCRNNGWTIEREENELGASCIAAPILAGGAAEASISIAAPAESLDHAMTGKIVDLLLRETAAIGHAIDHQRVQAASNNFYTA